MASIETNPPAARGTLKQRPLPRLLQVLFRKRVTGFLSITDESGDLSRIFLREGFPIYAGRPDDLDRLDRVLVDCGFLSAPVVAKANEEATAKKRRLGDVLVEQGALSEKSLAELLKTQLRRKITRLFFVRQGAFEVFLEPHNFGTGDDFARMRVDPRCLIYPAIRSSYDDARLQEELQPLANFTFRLVALEASLLEAMGYPPTDAAIVALRGGRRLTLQKLETVSSKPFDARAAVLALLYTDFLEVEPLPGKEDTPSPTRRSTLESTITVASGGDSVLRAQVQSLSDRLDQISHFEVLGVSESATAEEINGAYMRAVRQFHPDRLAGPDLSDLIPQAERVMARLSDAVAVLKDPRRRAEYVAERSGASKKESAKAILDAETNFQKGEVHLRKKDYARAIEAFGQAAKDNPHEPQYVAYYTWARFEDPGARKETLARQTLAVLEKVVGERPRFAQGHYWIGLVWKFLNDPARAEKAFREALAQKAGFLEAEREIRLMEMRRAKAAQSQPANTTPASARSEGGLLNRFFKRGD